MLSLLLALTVMLGTPASPAGQSRSQIPDSAAPARSQSAQSNNPVKTEAPQADLDRMRILLEQMQENLGMVQNLNTPLRHQFELEIEMWQLVFKQMAGDQKQTSGCGKP
jgi:hypothetical protein